ncbi:MAG: OmpA family protein [Pedobacter sp.]
MRTLSILLVICIAGLRANAQFDNNAKALADRAFKNRDYYEAAYYYKKVAEGMKMTSHVEVPFQGAPSTKPEKNGTVADRLYIAYQLAESYRLYENYIEAEPWYDQVLNQNGEAGYPLARLWYGVCLRANQRFEQAIVQLKQFSLAYRGDAKFTATATKEIANCEFAIAQHQYPALLDVNKLKGNWDSDGSDYAVIKKDANYWFTSSRLIKDDKKHLNRVYHLAANSDKPEIMELMKDDRQREVEYGTPALSPNGRHLYFTRWYKEGSRTIHAIYWTTITGDSWTTPVKLSSNVNAEGFNSIQPFITADGKQLFFISNKPGGQGSYDIWVSDLDSQGNPINSKNLGPGINTAADEQAPCYDVDSKRLVFSSKGYIGLGGFDFFESYGSINTNWKKPENLGFPMNSAKDDLYFTPDPNDSKRAIISSDRESDCCLEVFTVINRQFVLSGIVTDCDTHKPLAGVKVSFIDSLSKQAISSMVLGKEARYAFKVGNKRPYQLMLEKKGYFTKIVPVPTSGVLRQDSLFSDQCLQSFEVGKAIEIKNVLYDFNKATLRPESQVELNKLVGVMKDNPNIKIELSSHTDSIGSQAYNLKLSQDRAQACVDYIISKGIAESRIFAKGYGKSRPVAPNSLPNGKDNPEGRQLNRRTEFTVLKVE